MRVLILSIYLSIYLFPVLSQTLNPSDTELRKMNNVRLTTYKDIHGETNDSIMNILVFGNSILRHGVAKTIGWDRECGMAASSLEKDYIHVLHSLLQSEFSNYEVNIRYVNLVNFERNFQEFNLKSLRKLIKFNSDVVVFQLGENVRFDETKTDSSFIHSYSQLINSFNCNARVITYPFFPSKEKNKAIRSVALQTNSIVCDLSRLVLLEPENYVINEQNYKGDKDAWLVSGIGKHPGDIGMQNIAYELFVQVKSLLTVK